ncbi:DUF7344 domain-containing protein [Halovenus sp. HT40]|uniref:DUF7344 domain-containing protein n=1 Tax=Halovenus sp. HT40 TaxID=3126691 RepID=UPI00300F1FB3
MVEIPDSVASYTDCSISTIHHTLQASRRRLAIGFIAHEAISSTPIETTETPTKSQSQNEEVLVSVRQLAREIVSVEEEVSVEKATGEPYHNVYTALIQTHLPKLDDVGAIEYNSNRKTITPDQNLPALSIVAAITSPVAQLLFHDAVARLHVNGTRSRSDSIND